jgi:hypothetical protein
VLTLTEAPDEQDRLVELGSDPPVLDASLVAVMAIAPVDVLAGLFPVGEEVAVCSVELGAVVAGAASGSGGVSVGSGSELSAGGSPLATDMTALSMSALGSASCSPPWRSVMTVSVDVVVPLTVEAERNFTDFRKPGDIKVAVVVPDAGTAMSVMTPR